MGEYICEIVFNAGHAEEHRVRPQPLFVGGKFMKRAVAQEKRSSHKKARSMSC